ncbi:hypothetical protein F1728_29570 [Gimesia benthica]|uniref:Secreted protein n=1 Tax=Gimesia benthica TaxID=2608982 RepID=A0A6I6ALT1_9PLAN|nr:hypothetical protein [Gimesia benthica]QGQ26572.1 hypothetical protein F1728_29570 [Gimesia benthica]
MTEKLFSFLCSLMILVCPLNCMPAGAESTDAVSTGCCSHCQPPTSETPLSPESASDECCQCFCFGAIHDKADQLDLTLLTSVWAMPVLSETESLVSDIHSVPQPVSSAPPPPAGRALRCAQMSFLC